MEDSLELLESYHSQRTATALGSPDMVDKFNQRYSLKPDSFRAIYGDTKNHPIGYRDFNIRDSAISYKSMAKPILAGADSLLGPHPAVKLESIENHLAVGGGRYAFNHMIGLKSQKDSRTIHKNPRFIKNRKGKEILLSS